MRNYILTTALLLCFISAKAQYDQKDDFKHAFSSMKLEQNDKPKLSFEQRDVLHTNIAGGVLATVAIPVVVASALTFVNDGENTNMAATGLAFGGLALGGSFTLHSLGIMKAVKYHKGRKSNDAFNSRLSE